MRNEEDYTRVTEVLDPFAGLEDLKKNYPEVLNNAAQRGKRIHEACDLIIDNPNSYFPDPEFPGDHPYIESFKEWYFNKIFLPKTPRFFCDELMLTGECDRLYEDDRGLVLVDFKTPANESKTWPLQGSAYSHLAKKAGYDIKAIEFVRLKKTGKAPKVYSYKENFSLYKSFLDVYRYSVKDRLQESYLDYL